jgi:archaeal flagellar protein FlaJ
MMAIEKKQILGIVAAVVILLVDLIFLRGDKIFYFILGIGAAVGLLPFLISVISESNKEKENNEMFLEFSRNLVESVKAGTPISKSIINVTGKNFGSLTPHIVKLGNQIALGIPVKDALRTFANDVNSSTVTRAIMLISEAEKAGGEIDKILESVAKSVSEIEILKKERRAAIYSLMVQGYIIFLIFIVIMLILQFKILPLTAEFSSIPMGEFGFGGGGTTLTSEQLSSPFLYLLLAQGLFAGLVIGKLAEGNLKAGIKHSFIMIVMAYLITTGARAFMG